MHCIEKAIVSALKACRCRNLFYQRVRLNARNKMDSPTIFNGLPQR